MQIKCTLSVYKDVTPARSQGQPLYSWPFQISFFFQNKMNKNGEWSLIMYHSSFHLPGHLWVLRLPINMWKIDTINQKTTVCI